MPGTNNKEKIKAAAAAGVGEWWGVGGRLGFQREKEATANRQRAKSGQAAAAARPPASLTSDIGAREGEICAEDEGRPRG